MIFATLYAPCSSTSDYSSARSGTPPILNSAMLRPFYLQLIARNSISSFLIIISASPLQSPRLPPVSLRLVIIIKLEIMCWAAIPRELPSSSQPLIIVAGVSNKANQYFLESPLLNSNVKLHFQLPIVKLLISPRPISRRSLFTLLALQLPLRSPPRSALFLWLIRAGSLPRLLPFRRKRIVRMF